jgi:hypothetical protein
VASFLPFHTTYWLNGHNFIEIELKRSRVQFRKNDNAFLWVSNPKALQAAADRLSPSFLGRIQPNDIVTITGFLQEKKDVYGKTFHTIEAVSLKQAK